MCNIRTSTNLSVRSQELPWRDTLCDNPVMSLSHRVFRHPLEWNIGDRVGLKYLQKYVYPYLTRRYGARDVLFINYGYEEDPPMAITLDDADEPNRYSIQLYHRVATQVDLAGKDVLEVGCGHGGGASYLLRNLSPASYTGLDLNAAGIDFCQRRHPLTNLTFVQGDAEDLPFPDESFDVLLNVESSIHYRSFPRFLAEVTRVLRPGGHFLYTDGRTASDARAWEDDLDHTSMRMVSRRDINPEVLLALEKNGSRENQQGVYRYVPKALRDMTRVWILWVFRALQSGRISYRMYNFIK